MTVLWACESQSLREQPAPTGVGEVTFSFPSGNPPSEIDILFVLDNSPSMASKRDLLAENLPKMMQVLSTRADAFPDLHIGVVSSDFGEGSPSSNLEEIVHALGDRGLLWGNDPAPGAIATVAGGKSNGCGLDAGARWIEDIQSRDGFGRKKNYTGELADVFSCLAQGVGFSGSPYPHPLQALRVALNPQSGVNEANNGFLRPKAYLFIVILADEDDCSATPNSVPDDPNRPVHNDGIFTRNLPLETSRLRCAGRGHVCNGQAIPNYSPTDGYDGSQGPVSLNFADCAAKDPKDPPDYRWLPLIPVQDAIDSVVQAKRGNKDSIDVSGIIGWPTGDDLSGVKYQIDQDPASSRWDIMPVCSRPAVDSGQGYEAHPGLRLKKFIDAFAGRLPAIFSICSQDFTDAMAQMPGTSWRPISPGCIQWPLIDADPNTPQIDPACRVKEGSPCDTPGVGRCSPDGYQEDAFAQCKDSEGKSLNPATAEADRSMVPDDHRPCWALIYDNDKIWGCPDSFRYQRISILRKAGHNPPVEGMLHITCSACLREDQRCPR